MPFTFTHGFISYLIVRFFSRDINIRRIAFLGGLMPDIDGYHLLLGDMKGYKEIHRELLHPPFYGIIFGIFVSAIFYLYCKKKNKKFNYTAALIVFAFSYFLHSLVDAITSNWAINFLYPFGTLYLSDILNLKSEFLLDILDITISVIVIILLIFLYYKDRTVIRELF